MTIENIENKAKEQAEIYMVEAPYQSRPLGSYRKGFIEGSDWRINSVWHDGNVSCEPRRTAVVLFKNGNANIYKDLRDLSYEGLWGEVDKFAYLGDLIPERKEETR